MAAVTMKTGHASQTVRDEGVADANALVGRAVRRREDDALVTGQGRYVSDIPLHDALHLAFVRSPLPRGTILGCDVEAAREMAGVAHVVTGTDLSGFGARDGQALGRLAVNPVLPFEGEAEFPVLACGSVAAVGQPVAAVLAGERATAQDAADLIGVDIDEDGAAPDYSNGDAPGFRGDWSCGDVAAGFAAAHLVVEVEVEHPRLAPSPLEPRAIAVDYDAERDRALVWYSTQTPHRARRELCRILGIEEARIAVRAPDVGGAFGMKASLYPEEVFAVWAAFRFRRSVRWASSRSEDLISATHGRGARSRGRLALDAEGRFLALEAAVDCPLGHWLPNSAGIPAWNAGRILPGGYDIPAVDIRSRARLSHSAAVGIYRGAGRPEANCLMERLVDEAASASGIDPLEIRRRNLLSPDRLPHTGATGTKLDSGRYAELLDKLARDADYDRLKTARDRTRAEGGVAGLGLAFYVEPCGTGWESARVTLHPDGSADVATGGSSQGHGRETAFAQIAADRLSLPLERVRVLHGSTDDCPTGIGALASRSTPIGGSALAEACDALLAKLEDGADRGKPVSAEVVYEAKGEAWGYGAYLVLLTIDPDTGTPTIEEAHCCDDIGTVINPMMVEGQIRGGFAQGIGEALMERIVYDADGQLLTGSLMDYALPRASDMPSLSIGKMSTPSPANTLGAKGVGEAGTIGAPAAILNAANDALRPHGAAILSMPLTAEALWRALRSAPTR